MGRCVIFVVFVLGEPLKVHPQLDRNVCEKVIIHEGLV